MGKFEMPKGTKKEIHQIYERVHSVEAQLHKDKGNERLRRKLITLLSAIGERAETAGSFYASGGTYRSAGSHSEELKDYLAAWQFYNRANDSYKNFDPSGKKLGGEMRLLEKDLKRVRRLAALDKITEDMDPIAKSLYRHSKGYHAIIVLLIGLITLEKTITGNVIGAISSMRNIVGVLIIILGLVLSYLIINKNLKIMKFLK